MEPYLAPPLCDVCVKCITSDRNVYLSDGAFEIECEHHEDATSLILSSDAKCPICKAFWNQLPLRVQALMRNYEDDEFLTSLTLRREKDDHTISLNIDPNYLAIPELPYAISRSFVFHSSDEVRSTSPPYLHEDNTGKALSIARSWMERCMDEHPRCSPPDDGWRPTRLLDIEQDNIRLILGNEVLPGDRYMTLSYCWGDASFFKLSKETFAQLRKGIEVDSLPLTFQHAIQTTRFFGVKYLWIDGLCIMQDPDDKSDWLREALLMHKVYSGSFLNISATACRDSRGGLFFPRDATEVFSTTFVSLPHGDGENIEYALLDLGIIDNDFSKSPIHRRGWVLQERLLAPRVLHFSANELYWECRAGFVCERWPSEIPSVLTTDRALPKMWAKKGDGDRDEIYESLCDTWSDIMYAYTDCNLTFLEDKLVALSGIVKQISGDLEDEYVAGFWRKALLRSLPWDVSDTYDEHGELVPPSRSAIYRAPTWSWLSMNSRISCFLNRPEDLILYADIVDVKMEYQTQDTTILITQGLLYLRGVLRRVQLTSSHVDQCYDLTLDGLINVPGAIRTDISHADLEERSTRGEVYMIHLFDRRGTLGYDQGETYCAIDSLILECVDTSVGLFERLGAGAVVEKGKEYWPPRLELKREANGHSLPCHEYDEASGLHTIIIR